LKINSGYSALDIMFLRLLIRSFLKWPWKKRVSHANIKNEAIEVFEVSLICISKASLMSMTRTTPIEDSDIK